MSELPEEQQHVLDAALKLSDIILNAKVFQARVASLKAEKEDVQQRIAELANKEAAIEKRIAAQAAAFVKERAQLDEEWASFKEWKFVQEARISSEASKVPALEAIIASATATILNESGLRQHPLQGGADLIDLLRQMFSAKNDPHFSADTTGRQADHTFEIESLPEASKIATVRRSRPPRPTSHDA
jgi:DNA repair exonuclease SbcCD ATPase subunit